MRMIRVVLVDDHPVVRSGIRGLLEQADDINVVGEASTGEEAISLLENMAVDVILLDVEMPGMNGIEVAKHLTEIGASAKVLALSAYDEEAYIDGLLTSGAAGYLTKEEALHRIVEAVRGVAHGEDGWMSRRVTAKIIRQRASGDRDPLTDLSEREIDVVRLLAQGMTNGQMALSLSRR